MTKEEKIREAIATFKENYQSNLDLMQETYNSLQIAREQLPYRFLTKTGIEDHIKRVVITQDKYIKKLEKKFDTYKVELESLKEKHGQETDKAVRQSYKQQASRILEQREQVKVEIEKLSNLKFETNAERVKYFYEDLLLFVSSCKHEAREVWRYSLALCDDLDTDISYCEAQLLLEVADEYLKSKGFAKVSESLRKAFVNSQEDFKELKKLYGRVKALKDSSRKLLDNFEADEVNYRKFSERKTLGGSL